MPKVPPRTCPDPRSPSRARNGQEETVGAGGPRARAWLLHSQRFPPGRAGGGVFGGERKADKYF